MNIDFSKGLVPVIVRDAQSGAILTLAYMNEEALERTRQSGETWFWSRSRRELWNKGATSGNRQKVVHIAADCDGDALIVSVEPAGPACHTGRTSCFEDLPLPLLAQLTEVLRSRFVDRPPGSYSTYLFESGRDKILKKIGEEATEVVIAGKGESPERLVSEVADLVYHLTVLLVDAGLDWRRVEKELSDRANVPAP